MISSISHNSDQTVKPYRYLKEKNMTLKMVDKKIWVEHFF